MNRIRIRRSAWSFARLAPFVIGAPLIAAQQSAPPPEPPPEPAYRPLGINAKGMALFERPRDHARVVWIPAGSFVQNGYFPQPTDDPPHQTVTLPAYAIDETEVTNAQFAAFLNETGKASDEQGRPLVVSVESGLVRNDSTWLPADGCERLPALGVTGWGALAYAAWAGVDLPRLAEWQKAAGGPHGTQYPWGDDELDATRANGRRFGPDMPMPVGSYPAGASFYGCFDMAGNAYERVVSGERGGLPMMIRGGSWASPSPLNLRTFDLCMQSMDVADRTVGFRCVVRSGKGLPFPPAVPLRLAHSWKAAVEEASARNVPLLLSLQYDTCGQCDRTKVGLFRDPQFVGWCNEHCVVAVGHVAHDGSSDPHPWNGDGSCTLYPGLACHEHAELFDDAIKVVQQFVVSPGNFILDPNTADGAPPDDWIVIGERDLPKWGGGADLYLEKLAKAQEILGEPKLTRAAWLAQQAPASKQ